MTDIFEKALRGLPLKDIPIIDIHNHMGPYHQFNIPGNSPGEMIESMDNLGIDLSFITAHGAAVGGDYKLGNDMAMKAVKDYPDRFIAYVTLNPHYKDEFGEELERCFAYEGFKGIKLHPGGHGTNIDDKAYDYAYAYAQERRLPVLIHVWGRGDVAAIDRVSGKYPHAVFIMGHGGADGKAMEDATRVITGRENAYVDIAISMAPQGNIEWFVDKAGSSKILFGTDMPFYDPRPTFGRVAMACISEEDKRNIFALNAKRILPDMFPNYTEKLL